MRERAVNDLVWLPGLVGVILVIYAIYPNLELELLKVGLVGAVMLGAVFLGIIGQADAIAWTFIASDPSLLSPILPLIVAALVLAGHAAYGYRLGRFRRGLTIPIDRFLHEQQWIPKAIIVDGVRTEVSSDVNQAREEVQAKKTQGAMVEVKYGVPTVAYLGLGYLAFLAYLVIFNQAGFLGLP